MGKENNQLIMSPCTKERRGMMGAHLASQSLMLVGKESVSEERNSKLYGSKDKMFKRQR